MTRSIFFVLLLVSVCLFKPTKTYPHANSGIEPSVPLVESSNFPPISNSTTSHSKRQGETRCHLDYCPEKWKTNKLPAPEEEYFHNIPTELLCEPPPAPGQKYRDAHARSVRHSARWFCHKYADFELWDPSTFTEPIIHRVNNTGRRSKLFEGGRVLTTLDAIEEQEARWNLRIAQFFEFKIEPIAGCLKEQIDDHEEVLNPKWPLYQRACKRIIANAWRRCNNKGRGGSLAAGCFRYGVRVLF